MKRGGMLFEWSLEKSLSAKQQETRHKRANKTALTTMRSFRFFGDNIIRIYGGMSAWIMDYPLNGKSTRSVAGIRMRYILIKPEDLRAIHWTKVSVNT